jgi:hypothetical protein
MSVEKADKTGYQAEITYESLLWSTSGEIFQWAGGKGPVAKAPAPGPVDIVLRGPDPKAALKGVLKPADVADNSPPVAMRGTSLLKSEEDR